MMEQGQQFHQPSLFDDEPEAVTEEKPAEEPVMCNDCWEPMRPTGSKPKIRRGKAPMYEWHCARHGSIWHPKRPPSK